MQLAPGQTVRLVVGDLVKSAGLTGTYGGLRFEVAERAGSIDTVYFFYDEVSGFSAIMKMFDHDPTTKLQERLFAGNKIWTTWAPMLPLENPDPALGLPAGTQLRPKVFLRNTTPRLQTANVKLTWRSESKAGLYSLPPIQLKPFQTPLVDIQALQQTKRIPADAHWALVEIGSSGNPDDIMAIASSYDSTGRYGAQTPFADQLADHWVAGKFEVDSAHNSLIAVTNAGKKPTEAVLTFHYNHGQEHYQVRRTIAPGDQLWLNLGDIIHGRIPDSKGKMFPSDLNWGTYDLREPGHAGDPSLFEGKIIVDKTYGHLAYSCTACCGLSIPGIQADPENLPVQAQDTLGVWAMGTCDDQEYDISASFGGWDTSSHAVATMSSRQITGVGAGSTHAFASGTYNCNNGVSKYCALRQASPQNTSNVCAIPSSESTQVAGTAASKGYPAITEFNQTISDTRGDSFDNKTVEELSGGPGTNTCFWAGNPIGLLQYPVVSGGVWTVAGDDVPGQHNHWGYDNVGYPNSAGPAYIRTNGPAHGVSIPCTQSLFQDMVIWCDANTNYNYKDDTLTITVNAATTVTNCRAGVCQTISGY